MSHRSPIWFIAFFALLSTSVQAGHKWHPITQADWQVSAEAYPNLAIRDAVILFEEVQADDRGLLKQAFYRSYYQRVRILTAEGRKYADITLPYLDKLQKIEEVKARTVLPDGREIKLQKDQIFEKEIFKAKGTKIKQLAFSMPGVTDDCIIEYYVKYRLPSPAGRWTTQKDLPLLRGRLEWRPYMGEGLRMWDVSGNLLEEVAEFLTPNYLWLPKTLNMQVEKLPSPEEVERIVFRIENVRAFKREPHSLPDDALKQRLIYYYSDGSPTAVYWGKKNKQAAEGIVEYCRDNKRVAKVVETFASLPSDEAKILAAYRWCQENVENLTYSDAIEKPKKRKHVDDVVKRGYGSARQINLLFLEMLNQMGIDAKLAYVVDRDEDLFVSQAKYWQFDRAVVAVPDGAGYELYSPGNLFLPPKSLPWYCEGITAFVIDDMNRQFYNVPFCRAEANRTFQQLSLTLTENELRGTFQERHTGHGARAVRLRVYDLEGPEVQQKLEEWMGEKFENVETDSIQVELNTNDVSAPVQLSAVIQCKGVVSKIGTRYLLKPFEMFPDLENPFTEPKRRYPVLFDHAYEQTRTLSIRLPEHLEVEAVPEPQVVRTPVGMFGVTFTSLQGNLTIQSTMKVTVPYVTIDRYAQVKRLFEGREKLRGLTVALKRKSS